MTKVWAVVAALLALVIVWEVLPEAVPEAAAPVPVVAGKAARPGVDPGALARELDAALARPIFAPNRRPAPEGEAGPDATPDAPDAPLPRLSGIVVSPAGTAAIFVPGGGVDSRPVVVHPGGRIGAYTVRAIGDGTITVSGPGGERTIRPSFGDAPPPAPGGPLQLGVPQPSQGQFQPQPLPGQTPQRERNR